MRHLRVPKRETQATFEALLKLGYLAPRARILNDGDYNLVPVDVEAPDNLGTIFSDYDFVDAEQPDAEPHKWISHLEDILPHDVIEEYKKVNK